MNRSPHIGFRAAVWVAAFVIVAGFAGMSRAECPAYPDVDWWKISPTSRPSSS